MSGNVWEWPSDWYEDFGTAAVTDSTGPGMGVYRVLRGGCRNYDSEGCRVLA